jgi:hypothetical protein
VTGDLTPAEMLEAASAFAELHRWAALAWRHVATGKASREAVQANADDMTTRLEQLRDFLAESQTTDGSEEL